MTRPAFSKVFNPEPGWYAGDFHVHTNTSRDGEDSPARLAELAQAEGLDFLAVTDHNTIEGFSNIEDDMNFPFIPGIEVTLTGGHFNVFGMESWRPWLEDIYMDQKAIPLPAKFPSVNDLLRQTAGEGLLNSINHPLLKPWDWLFVDTDLRYVHCVELWNDLYWPDNTFANPKTVELWTEWLNNGQRVVAIAGSDYHYPPKPDQGLPGERLGQPTTCIFAEELSAAAILDGIRKRRVYVTKGPRVDFLAICDGKTYAVGDDLAEYHHEIEFTAAISHEPQRLWARLVRNGEVIAQEQVGEGQSVVQFGEWETPTPANWYRLDVLDASDQALVITNPIFVNYHQK